MRPVLSRRGFGIGAFGWALGTLELEVRELPVGGAYGPAFVLGTPRGAPAPEALVVLLHGLAETVDPAAGRHAWVDRYGLATAYTRLRRAPVAAFAARDDWGPGRLAELAAATSARPFRGFAVACPYTPNPYRAPEGTARSLARYAAWLEAELTPAARAAAGIGASAPAAIGGCSLGGFVGLEAYARSTAWAAFGGVQAAFGEGAAPAFARRLAPRARVALVTSTGDPYRAANVALAAELARAGAACPLVVRPGPHDQPWLRESGTIELLWALDELLAKPLVAPRVPPP